MRPRGAANIAKTVKYAEAGFSLTKHRNSAATNSYFDKRINCQLFPLLIRFLKIQMDFLYF